VAKKAVTDGDEKLARRKLDEALALEPRESLFHDLRGDLYALNKQHDRALKSYERAIDANPDFFYGHLRSGQMKYLLARHGPARNSLNRSQELMPTAEAHYLLGMLDREAGNNASALEHFRTAAQSDSESGKKAARELVIMDLSNDPSRYIASRAVVNSRNEVWVQFANRTSVPVERLEITYAWLDDQGQTRQARKTWRGPLAGGQQNQLSLGIRLKDAAELDRRVRVQITGARVAN
jgi:tetratricopeptide (TPR) repeat protein